MKCQICKKNQATDDVWCNINGKKSNLSLCSECAKKIADSVMPNHSHIYDDIGLGSLASALFNMAGSVSGMNQPEILKAVDKCPSCGMTYEIFASKGKLGCSECYKTFHDRMLRPLKQIHGTYEHVGKIPNRAGVNLRTTKTLDILKAKLDEAIHNQEFERAAEIRDEIKKIRGEE